MAFQNKEINNSNQDNPQLEAVGADHIIQLNPLLNKRSKITSRSTKSQTGNSCSTTAGNQQPGKHSVPS